VCESCQQLSHAWRELDTFDCCAAGRASAWLHQPRQPPGAERREMSGGSRLPCWFFSISGAAGYRFAGGAFWPCCGAQRLMYGTYRLFSRRGSSRPWAILRIPGGWYDGERSFAAFYLIRGPGL
jgi:hypothetical protein